MALAGVEAAVGSEVGIDDDGHQAGLPADVQVAEVGSDGLHRAVGETGAQHAAPLGEQHRAVGREGDAPGVRQARNDRC